MDPIAHNRFAIVPAGYMVKDFAGLSKEQLRITAGQFFEAVLEMVKERGQYEQMRDIIDYTSPDRWNKKVLCRDEFRFIADVRAGGSEGIYIDCMLEGDFDDSEDKMTRIGTVKSLSEDIEGYALMGRLAGALVYCAIQFQQKDWVRFLPEKELDAFLLKQQEKTIGNSV